MSRDRSAAPQSDAHAILTTTIEHVVDIDARPEIVFDLWTSSDGLTAWWGTAATANRRVGGDLRVDVDGQHVMVGRFIDLQPPHRLAFTFGWEHGDPPPGSTRVDVAIEATPTGSRVTVRHRDLPVDHLESHARGWTHFLGERLSAVTG